MTETKAKNYHLSKTLFTKGIQCHKSLYLTKYHPELKDEITPSQEALFQRGNEVGYAARDLFPGGIEIPYEELSHEEQISMTRSEIKKGTRVLYEAAFNYGGVFIKADILHKGKRGWEIYEVKSSTKVEDVHINDVAIQYHVLKGSGLPVSKAFVVHINNKYVRKGDIDVEKLFMMEDVTKSVKDIQPFIKNELRKQRRILKGNMPEIDIGEHCDDPYECNFKNHCWAHIPENSVFDLRGKGANPFELYRKGIIHFKDVPKEALSSTQIVQVQATLKKKNFIKHKKVNEFLNSLWYPLCFLDFETITSPIPLWDGTRPYQQIPFQYSLHMKKSQKGKLVHFSYLAPPNTDPRQELIVKLTSEIPDNACVIVYTHFEKDRLNDLANWFPKYRKKLENITGRLVDLAVPFRKQDVYLWQMSGSHSIKKVLPAIAPNLNYDNMEIRDGGMAMDAYSRMCKAQDSAEIKSLRKALLEYCRLDTLAMVGIVEKLESFQG